MSTVRNAPRALNLDRAAGKGKIEEENADAHKKDSAKDVGDGPVASVQRAASNVVNATRARALNAGAAMRDTLLKAIPDQKTQDEMVLNIASAVLGLFVGNSVGRIIMAGEDAIGDKGADVVGGSVDLNDIDKEAEKELLAGLEELGFEGIESLTDPKAADAKPVADSSS